MKNKKISVLYTFFAVGVLGGSFLLMQSVMAENSSVDNVTIVIPQSCTLGGVVDTAHTVTLNSGQHAENVGQTTIKAFCNDPGGYSIYAIGSSDDEDGNTDLVSSIRSDYNIETGLAMSGGASAWAMKLTGGTVTNPTTGVESTPPIIDSDTEGTFSAYHTVPEEWTRVAYRQSSTDMNTDVTKTGSFITTTYRVYVSGSQPAGSYEGQVKYVMIHPDEAGATIMNLEDAFNAVYEGVEASHQMTIGGKNYYMMQSMTSTICGMANILGEASQMQLADERDQSIYWVTKLEDGHCWMTQNLDLDLDSTGTVALNSNNTDINQYGSNGYNSANGYSCSNADTSCSGGVITWVPERSTIDGPSNLNSTSWVDDRNNPYSYNPGTGTQTDPGEPADGHRLTGNYYNWTAAIASNASNSFSSSTLSNTSNNPKNSVCPKGWRLPTISDQTGGENNSTNEFKTLNILYNGGLTNDASNLMAAPLYLARSGMVSSGKTVTVRSRGYYWSSTVRTNSNALFLLFGSGSVSFGGTNRSYGSSVRCVAR